MSSLRDYSPAAPHGPNMTSDHAATQNVHEMSPLEANVLDSILRPDDSYSNGVYWADMEIRKRTKFVRGVDSAEARREVAGLKTLYQKGCEGWNGPLAWIGWIRGSSKLFASYCKNAVLPGAGLLLEGYVLFSIGNVRPLLQYAFPRCWKTHEICNETWLHGVEYLEVVGIIFGMAVVGFEADWLGRRWGLVQDAAIMLIGLIILTAAWGVTQNGWVICYACALFIYGFGVGGEYPMTATSGMENAVGSGKISIREDRLHRGRKVVSAFLMQGWGQFWNLLILMLVWEILQEITQGNGSPPYSKTAVQWTYRVDFFIPAVGTAWLVYYRAYKMKSAGKQLAMAKKKSNVSGYDTQSLRLTFTHFGPRLLATSGAWFANDVFFYGNKLFQNQFIEVITPGNTSVVTTWKYNLINIGVSLVGYYLASLLIDNKTYGRKWMMIVGFLGCFVLFVVPGYNYDFFISRKNIHAFQAMYFLSSFFNQFGPNSVTFLVAAEVFPTPIRATAHGFSAAIGKLGALLAAVLYNYIGTRTKFHVVPWFGLAGAILTWLFLPDTTGLDLKEQERRWAYIRAGREQDYHGIAIHPKHLSLWERIRGVGKNYDPDADYKQRLEEMRGEWEAWQARKAEEKLKEEDFDEDDSEFSEEVSNYFSRTAKNTLEQSPDIFSHQKGSPSSQGSSVTDCTEKIRI